MASSATSNSPANSQSTFIKKLDEERKKLPLYVYRDQLLEAIENYQVLVIVGEPGCGKTTEIPLYLHEDGYTKGGKKKIGITLPGGFAHVMPDVAAKVAEEMGVQLGHEVGYYLNNLAHTSSDVLIKYMTDGILVRQTLVVTQTLVLHVTESPGDILVFLPGQQEIEIVDHSLKQIMIARGHTQLITCPIRAEVLEPTPQGVRKVVLATSPAEISWLMCKNLMWTQLVVIKEKYYVGNAKQLEFEYV